MWIFDMNKILHVKTKWVNFANFRLKGSDASWRDDCEPPPQVSESKQKDIVVPRATKFVFLFIYFLNYKCLQTKNFIYFTYKHWNFYHPTIYNQIFSINTVHIKPWWSLTLIAWIKFCDGLQFYHWIHCFCSLVYRLFWWWGRETCKIRVESKETASEVCVRF